MNKLRLIGIAITRVYNTKAIWRLIIIILHGIIPKNSTQLITLKLITKLNSFLLYLLLTHVFELTKKWIASLKYAFNLLYHSLLSTCHLRNSKRYSIINEILYWSIGRHGQKAMVNGPTKPYIMWTIKLMESSSLLRLQVILVILLPLRATYSS